METYKKHKIPRSQNVAIDCTQCESQRPACYIQLKQAVCNTFWQRRHSKLASPDICKFH